MLLRQPQHKLTPAQGYLDQVTRKYFPFTPLYANRADSHRRAHAGGLHGCHSHDGVVCCIQRCQNCSTDWCLILPCRKLVKQDRLLALLEGSAKRSTSNAEPAAIRPNLASFLAIFGPFEDAAWHAGHSHESVLACRHRTMDEG
jgi:hypothetical protein